MSRLPDVRNVASLFDSIRADYDATRQSRFIRRRTGVAPLGGPADYHFREEVRYYDLIEQARDMDRNDGLVGCLADRRVDNIVQQGFTLDTKTGDKGLDLELWNRWQAFANDPELCDIAGELCFHEMERLVCRSESIDGDCVVVGTEDGPFQTIEAHAIQTSSKVENTFLGVTRNQYGRREQYHVRYDLNHFGQKSVSEPIDVRNDDGVRQLFHIYNPKRFNVTRGVTQLAPVFSLSGMLEDINFAKLVQQQIVSCFAIFRKLASGTPDLPTVAGAYGEPSTEPISGGGNRQLEGIAPGMEIIGRAGEDITGFSPNVPNSEYFQQVKLILQIIGVNFGLPLCLVLMDGSETNFSGWRGAVDEARKGFIADQENLVRRFHMPGYLWWLNREISLDNSLKKASRRDEITIEGHKWNLPTWSYIEPVADAEGDLKQLQGALTSPRRMHAARGKDWETISEEIIADNAYAIQKAQAQADKINQAFPSGPMLTWRDLIPLPMQVGATIAMQDPAAVAAQETAAEKPLEKPKPAAKKKPVAANDGEWRTTEDGGKIFIGPDGDPKFGGPDGPSIKQDGDKATPKKPTTHNVALPKKRSSLKIDQANTALKQMGYTPGPVKNATFDKSGNISYEITSPDGTKQMMTADEIKKIVYEGAEKPAAKKKRPVAFDESKIKRDEDGKFGSGGGGNSDGDDSEEDEEGYYEKKNSPALKQKKEAARQQIAQQHAEKTQAAHAEYDALEKKLRAPIEQAESDKQAALNKLDERHGKELAAIRQKRDEAVKTLDEQKAAGKLSEEQYQAKVAKEDDKWLAAEEKVTPRMDREQAQLEKVHDKPIQKMEKQAEKELAAAEKELNKKIDDIDSERDEALDGVEEMEEDEETKQ